MAVCDHMREECKFRFDALDKETNHLKTKMDSSTDNMSDVRADIREILTEQKASNKAQQEMKNEQAAMKKDIKDLKDNSGITVKQLMLTFIGFGLGIIGTIITMMIKGR